MRRRGTSRKPPPMPFGEFALGLVGREAGTAPSGLLGQGFEEGDGVLRSGGDDDPLAVRPDNDLVPRGEVELVPEVLRDDDLPLRSDSCPFAEHRAAIVIQPLILW